MVSWKGKGFLTVHPVHWSSVLGGKTNLLPTTNRLGRCHQFLQTHKSSSQSVEVSKGNHPQVSEVENYKRAKYCFITGIVKTVPRRNDMKLI